MLRVGDDLSSTPAQIAIGYVRAAKARGATVLAGTTVTRVQVEDGRVEAVETDQRTVATPVVVDAAGAWTRQVGAASGIQIPLVPTRHQLFGLRTPLRRRPALGRVRGGAARFFDMDGLPRAGVREHRGSLSTMTADGQQPGRPGIAQDQLERDAAWQYRRFYGAV